MPGSVATPGRGVMPHLAAPAETSPVGVGSAREAGNVYDATVGLMFAFSLKRFFGSYLFFNCTSRA
jgi:hypothetical protein